MLRGKKRRGLNPRGGETLKSEGEERKGKAEAKVFSQGFYLTGGKKETLFL